MKTFALTAVLALAASANTASAADCLADVSALTATLTPIVAPAYACQTATGYTIITPVALPTKTQVKDICTKCQDLITGAKAIKFPDCTLTVETKAYPLGELFNQIVGQCDSVESTASNSTGAANATTTAPDANTTGPATVPATTVPAKEAGSTSGSTAADKSSATVEEPSATTKAPAATTAAPKSAGVSVTLGAAVAVACSVAALVL